MRDKIRVCFLADQHSLYDDRIYWKQALSLIKKGYEVYYISIGDIEDKGKTKEDINYTLLKRKKYASSNILNYLLKKLPFIKTEYDDLLNCCRQINPDIYHIHDLRINRVVNDLKAINPNIKLIYDAREPYDNNIKDYNFGYSKIPKSIITLYANYIQRWEYRKIKSYDYILTVDDGLYNRFSRNVPGIPIKNIYNYTNLSGQRKPILFQDKIYDAAYVGGISKVRGVMTAVKATRHIVKKIPTYKLLLLGQIFDIRLENEIKSYIEKYNLQENIVLKNHIPYQEISNYYNLIKIGLNPLLNVKAHKEIIQIKLFEYMNFGMPIITSNFGYMKKYTEDNNVGIAIEPNDEKLLADTILYLLQNIDAFNLYSKNGIKAVDEHYNWNFMEKELYKIYDELLNNK